jgi:hypothetical protein
MRKWRTGLKGAAALVAAVTAIGLSGTVAWAAPPSNDAYGGAVTIAALPYETTLDTTEATSGPNDDAINADCEAPATDASVWYKYTAESDGWVVADVSGSDYSAGVAVVTGTPGNFTFEGCGDGGFVWEASAGVTYVLLVFDDQLDGQDNGGLMSLVVDETTNPALRNNDFTGDGNADVVARDTYGRLYLYPGNGLGGWKPKIVYGYGWNAFTAMLAPGDFDGDGNADLMVRDSAGRLYLYPGNGAAGWLPRVAYGTGWNAMTAIVGVGDFDGDMAMDLLARDATGRLYLYPGDGAGGWLPRVAYGTGWNAMTAILGVGDFNGDATADVMARDTAGKLWLYPGDGAGGFLARVGYGYGWNAMTALTAPGDFSGDTFADLIARDSLGKLWLYRGNGAGGWLVGRLQIGTGWQGMTAIVS